MNHVIEVVSRKLELHDRVPFATHGLEALVGLRKHPTQHLQIYVYVYVYIHTYTYTYIHISGYPRVNPSTDVNSLFCCVLAKGYSEARSSNPSLYIYIYIIYIYIYQGLDVPSFEPLVQTGTKQLLT